MTPSPLLFAIIEFLPALVDDDLVTPPAACLVTCRVCHPYEHTVADLPAAQRLAWRHDEDHWRGAVPPPTPRKRRR